MVSENKNQIINNVKLRKDMMVVVLNEKAFIFNFVFTLTCQRHTPHYYSSTDGSTLLLEPGESWMGQQVLEGFSGFRIVPVDVDHNTLY